MSQLLLTHGIRMIDFVAENAERNLGEIFHGEEGVKFGFGFGKSFVVLGINEEDDAGDFGKVIFPETAGW